MGFVMGTYKAFLISEVNAHWLHWHCFFQVFYFIGWRSLKYGASHMVLLSNISKYPGTAAVSPKRITSRSSFYEPGICIVTFICDA